MVMVSGGTGASGLAPSMLGTCKGRLIGETLNQWLWAFLDSMSGSIYGVSGLILDIQSLAN